MNTFYYLNRAVGIAFALVLVGVAGYWAIVWRDDMRQEAGRRLQHRIKQISDQTAAEFDWKAPDWGESTISSDHWSDFQGVDLSLPTGEEP